MQETFNEAEAFDQDLRKWETSRTTNMVKMFNSAAAFFQNLAPWDTTRVTLMTEMFKDSGIDKSRGVCLKKLIAEGWNKLENKPSNRWPDTKKYDQWPAYQCAAFSPTTRAELKLAVQEWAADKNPGSYRGHPISDWLTDKVDDFSYLFCASSDPSLIELHGCDAGMKAFNGDVRSWGTSRVATMEGMFLDASEFNQDLASWDTGQVTSMEQMLSGASKFNQAIGLWDTSRVASSRKMFEHASAFNQNLKDWATLSVTSFDLMFSAATAFNHAVGTWDTSSVTSMLGTFEGASNFNQDLSTWETSKVVTTSRMFSGASNFNHAIGNWNTHSLTSMDEMFRDAAAFNQALDAWETNNVTSMRAVFHGASTFDRPIGSWTTSQVSDMRDMFNGALAFNRKAVRLWDVRQVKNMTNIFRNTALLSNSCTKKYVAGLWSNHSAAFKMAYSDVFEAWMAEDCTHCDPGFVCTDSIMSPCDAGYWCEENTFARGDQRECPSGTYGRALASADHGYATAQDACGLCPKGRYYAGRGLNVGLEIACRSCTAAYFCPGVATKEQAERGEDRISCPLGKFGINGTKAAVLEETACSACTPGRYGVKEGQIGLEAGCPKCPPGADSIAGSPGCYFRCMSLGYYWNNATKACIGCPPGTELQEMGMANKSDCSPCRSGYIAPKPATANCEPCSTGRYPNAQRTTCNECGDGTASPGALPECSKCRPGKFATAGAGFCTECLPGLFAASAGISQCEPCKEGEFAEAIAQTACKVCRSGSSDAGSSYCGACSAGTEFDGSRNTCRPCPNGSVSRTGGSCKRCRAGTYDANREHRLCAHCPPGRWSDHLGAETNATCNACAVGTFSSAEAADASSKCNACSPGKHSNVTGLPSSDGCVPCDAGFFAKDSGQSGCDVCLTGFSRNGSAYCTDCEAGKVLNRSYLPPHCTWCNRGSISESGATRCTQCGPGTFGDATRTSCIQCSPGTWSNDAGAADDTTCTKCGAGRFSGARGSDSAKMCNACPPGKYGNASGAISSARSCFDCSAGKHAASSGQTACEECTVGTSESGSSYCANCAAGKALDPSYSPPRCRPCKLGTMSAAGDPKCTKCKAGTYGNAERTDCAQCPTGTWSANVGTTSDATCQKCPKGSFSSSVGADSDKKCNACPPGKSGSEEGATSSSACSDCAGGKFALLGGLTECATCNTGTSKRGSSFCTDCAAGRELNNRTNPPSCADCPVGQTSISGKSCVSCEPGRYSAVLGAERCTLCPDRMTSLPGNASRCVAAEGFVLGDAIEYSAASRKRMLSKIAATTANNATAPLNPCPYGATCPIGTQIETLGLEPGFTRPTDTSLDVRPCKDNLGGDLNLDRFESVCVGGASTGQFGESVCRNETTGPYCATCAEGFVRQGSGCRKCEGIKTSEALSPLLLLLGVGVGVALASYVAYCRWKRRALKRFTLDACPSEMRVVVEKLKIVTGFVQVVTSLVEESNLRYPPVFTKLIEALSIFSFDVFDYLSIGCIVTTDFYGELVATCGAPVVLAFLVLAFVGRKRDGNTKESFTEIYLVVLFGAYPGVCRKIFNTFKCERFPTRVEGPEECTELGFAWVQPEYHNGICYRSFLRADLSLSCDADSYVGWRVLASIMIFVYPLGVPALFAWLLRHTDNTDRSLDFIRAAYEDDFYWWELVEIGRKFALTLVLVFFMEGSASQVVAVVIIAVAYFAVLRSYQPYKKSSTDNFFASVAQILLAFISLVVLCIKANVADEDGWDNGGMDFGLTILVTAVPVLGLLLGLQFQLSRRLQKAAKVAAEKLTRAEAEIHKMKKQLAAAQEIVDTVMNEEGGSLLASYTVKHSDLTFEKQIGEGHANLVCMLGGCWNEGADKLCLVLEFAENGGLDEFMNVPDFKPATGRRLVIDIARCLKYLHGLPCPVLHRDIKPANVLVTADICGKADFGESRTLDEANILQGADAMTMTMVGTPAFCAPEVVDGSCYNHKADTFSFALTAMEVWSGRSGFLVAQIRAHQRCGSGLTIYVKGWRPELPVLLVEQHTELGALVKECWQHDPAARPAFSDIVNRLEAIEASLKSSEDVPKENRTRPAAASDVESKPTTGLDDSAEHRPLLKTASTKFNDLMVEAARTGRETLLHQAHEVAERAASVRDARIGESKRKVRAKIDGIKAQRALGGTSRSKIKKKQKRRPSSAGTELRGVALTMGANGTGGGGQKGVPPKRPSSS